MSLGTPAGLLAALLQRGRALWGAEIHHHHRRGKPPDCFNGAAPCGARKCAVVGRDAAVFLQASTGPRLVGRGNPAENTRRATSVFRFNGAAPCGARKSRDPGEAEEIITMLQRGRALWGAEIDCFLFVDKNFLTASTGPRLVGRGNLRHHALHRQADTGFNGAAPCGARKYESLRVLHLQGVASTGPRLVGRGNPLDGGFCAFGEGVASTGPRLVGRGNSDQGGQDLSRIRSFNGAAPCGARKFREEPTSSQTYMSLQRGRALWGAEIQRAKRRQRNDRRELQRGRALWGAEMSGAFAL